MSFIENVMPLSVLGPGNLLIDRLPKRQRDSFVTQCDTVDLVSGSVLFQAGEPLDHAYFPLRGSIALLGRIGDREVYETENIGCEGMLGMTLVLGVNSANQCAMVQTPCLALRMKSSDFRTALDDQPALLDIIQRYLYVVLADLSQSTGCVRYHDVKSRLARGLLQAHDRVQVDHLPLLTHKLLARMLGVQRGSVTIAAARLQQEGIIQYSRGKIAILDRSRLKAAACECYAARVENYDSLLARHLS